MSQSLGTTLKKIRESRNLSLEDVSERTRIPKKILSTIEEDRLNELSSPFYARGFVKSYSQFLSALEEKAVKEYLSGIQKKAEPKLILNGEKVPGDWFLKHKKHIGVGILAVFSVYLLVFGFVQIGRFIRAVSVRSMAWVTERQRLAKLAEAKPKPIPSRETKKSPGSTSDASKEGFEIEIVAHYNTWIQVTSDKELLFRGILKKGDSDIWKAKTRIDLEVGNAGGVTLKLNGKKLGAAGKKGEKKTLVITKDGLKL